MGKTRHGSTIEWMANSILDLFPKKNRGIEMNTELKALLGLAFDVLALGKDAVAKKNFFAMLSDVWSVVSDITPAVQNIGDLQAELAALPNPQNQADIVAFLQTKVANAGASADMQNILAKSLKLVQDNVSDISDLLAAIKAA